MRLAHFIESFFCGAGASSGARPETSGSGDAKIKPYRKWSRAELSSSNLRSNKETGRDDTRRVTKSVQQTALHGTALRCIPLIAAIQPAFCC